MADSYGIEVYNSGGVKTFSLVDNIFRAFTTLNVTSSMVPYATGYIWVSYTSTNIDSGDFFFLSMPKSTSKTPYTQSGVSVSASDNPIGTKISCNIQEGSNTTVNGNKLFDYGDCRVILVGKA